MVSIFLFLYVVVKLSTLRLIWLGAKNLLRKLQHFKTLPIAGIILIIIINYYFFIPLQYNLFFDFLITFLSTATQFEKGISFFTNIIFYFI